MTDQPTSKFIVIHTLSHRFEADLLSDALEKEKIPVIVKSYEETAYDGLFVKQRGWGCLMVPDDLAFDACQIIEPLIRALEVKPLYADPSQVDPLLWERLRKADSQTISQNAQVRYYPEQAAYTIPFLDVELSLFPDRQCIEVQASNPYHRLNFELYLITLHYLLEAQPQGLGGKWISEKDIPGGELFFRGPHQFPTDRLIELFGSHPDLFTSASEKLGGTKVKMGDSAYRFWPFPRVPVLFVFWEGDDEFEPSLQIRFDAGISLHLQALDTIWAMVNVLCRSLYAVCKDCLEGMGEAGKTKAT